MAGHADPSPFSYVRHAARGLLAAELLLLATWNPAGLSYWDWAQGAERVTPLLSVAGIALVSCHIALARIAIVALGPSGILATLTLLGCALLAAWRLGLVNIAQLQTQPLVWLTGWAAILAAGLTWTKVQKRISGQRGVLKYPP